MKWFKHDTTATNDAKVKKLIIKHGALGYAVYFHCLELIAGNVNENNVTFELEHDAEIIADDLKISGNNDQSGREIVEQIMHTILELNLFEEDNGRIFCFKLLNRIDSSMTSNTRLRSLVAKAKEQQSITSHDTIMINHDEIMNNHARQDKTRLDYTRIEGATSAPQLAPAAPKERTVKYLVSLPIEQQYNLVSAYTHKAGLCFDVKYFVDWWTARNWLPKGRSKPLIDWQATARTWAKKEQEYGRGQAAPNLWQAESNCSNKYGALLDDIDGQR